MPWWKTNPILFRVHCKENKRRKQNWIQIEWRWIRNEISVVSDNVNQPLMIETSADRDTSSFFWKFLFARLIRWKIKLKKKKFFYLFLKLTTTTTTMFICHHHHHQRFHLWKRKKENFIRQSQFFSLREIFYGCGNSFPLFHSKRFSSSLTDDVLLFCSSPQ